MMYDIKETSGITLIPI